MYNDFTISGVNVFFPGMYFNTTRTPQFLSSVLFLYEDGFCCQLLQGIVTLTLSQVEVGYAVWINITLG